MRRHPSWKPSSTSPQMSGEPGEAHAEFADEQHIQIAPELREDLARAVLTAASTYLATPATRGQT
jgi:hypothetical protein